MLFKTDQRPRGRVHHLAVIMVIGMVVLIVFIYASRLGNGQDQGQQGIAVTDVLGNGDTTGYARAFEPKDFSFPDDHGPHPDYKHEWWYYTGNLETDTDRHFGFQLTFFRFSLKPRAIERDSQWAATQMMMAHLAVSDIEGNNFYHFEKMSRVALDLAGSKAQPFKVWVDDWSATGQQGDIWPMRLRAMQGDIEIDINLTPAKPVILQGERGLSRKNSEAGNASYYYSYSHLKTQGRIRIGADNHKVAGLSWLDREWGTSSLAADQRGWDWFALQLADGRELMLYQLRRKDGTIDPFSSGIIIDGDGIDTDGSSRRLAARDFSVDVLEQWQSPHTGIFYPARWRVHMPGETLDIEIEPLLDDQELHASVDYWEGAVRLHGTYHDKTVTGYGYVELTGYDQSERHIASD